MKKIVVLVVMLLSLGLLQGCSGKLSRREAKQKIDAMMEPHEVGPEKVKVRGEVPGFHLSSDDSLDTTGDSFNFSQHDAYGGLDFQKRPQFPDSEEFLLDALNKLGYINVQEEGPKTVMSSGMSLRYTHSRTVVAAQKMGGFKETGYSRDYATGFSCYPPPQYKQCNLPPLLEANEKGFTITGIVQDETRAKVNILIPWKLTPIATELKPYAKAVEDAANKFGSLENGVAGYNLYPSLYSWEHLLNSHGPSGTSPATILFQKFDDGWRIVDENGKSEKDSTN